jgi:adenylate cyclase
MLAPSLLTAPTPHVLPLVVRDALDRVAAARRRLCRAPEDVESVHALRVALTRLRALDAVWPAAVVMLLGDGASSRLRRAHRALRRVRNDDVRRALLIAAAGGGLPDGAGEGSETDASDRSGGEAASIASGGNDAVVRLVQRLEHRRPRRLAKALRRVERTLDPLLACAAHPAAAPDSPAAPAGEAPLFSRTLDQALHAAGQRALDAVDAGGSAADRHAARLAVKRLRALLQPWAESAPTLGPLRRVAAAGQDLLGAERDLAALRTFVARHTRSLARELAVSRGASRGESRRFRADARALRATLRTRHRAVRDALAREWLAPAASSRVSLHLALAATSAALRALRADPGAVARSAPAEEIPAAAAAGTAAPPATAVVVPVLAASVPPGVEIERKFLLRALPEFLQAQAGVRIAQGWLPGERLRERLRRTVHPDGRVEWTRTVKLGAGIARFEVEEPTDPGLFESLWPFTAAARVEKIRYAIPDGDLVWEIDRFLDRDLVLAEVELPSADAPAPPPAWLAPYILRDVTDDPDYVNANLARRRPPVAGA